MRMTPERIAAALARCEAASPGPWTWSGGGDPPMVWNASGDSLVSRAFEDVYLEPGDAAFIAHARAALPDALADLAELRAEVERLRDALRNLLASGVEHDDPRIGYVTMQVDRVTLNAARAALGEEKETT